MAMWRARCMAHKTGKHSKRTRRVVHVALFVLPCDSRLRHFAVENLGHTTGVFFLGRSTHLLNQVKDILNITVNGLM